MLHVEDCNCKSSAVKQHNTHGHHMCVTAEYTELLIRDMYPGTARLTPNRT